MQQVSIKEKASKGVFIDLYRHWEKGMYILNSRVICEILDSPEGHWCMESDDLLVSRSSSESNI